MNWQCGYDAAFGTTRSATAAATSCCTTAATGSWERIARSRWLLSVCCWIAGLEASCASSPWTRGGRISLLRSACFVSGFDFKSIAKKKVCEQQQVLVPKGRLNLAQDASPGYICNMIKSRRDG